MKKCNLIFGLALTAMAYSTFVGATSAVESVPPVMRAEETVKDAAGRVFQTDGWIPAGPSIYPQLKADPRQPSFAIGFRWYDQALGSNVGMANLGGVIPFWRGSDVAIFDRLECCVSGAAWAVFDMRANNLDLLNSDWYGGIPINAEIGDYKFRLRLYHISSHLGDEYLQRPGALEGRKNPSFEAVDLSVYTPCCFDDFYLYGSIGHIIHSDSTFPLQHLYFEAGTEYYVKPWAFQAGGMKAVPYAAIHSRFFEVFSFEPTYNAALGISWSNANQVSPEITTSLEYFRGFSNEGQFARRRSDYVCLRLTYLP
jgi:hypothetical protein